MGFDKKIAIPIVGTNVYLPLAIRFIKKFLHYYSGNLFVNFYLFTDIDPSKFLSSNENRLVTYIHKEHSSWVNAANSKFANILSLYDKTYDYLFYFDADTDIQSVFNEEWFIGEAVAGEHYANRTRMVAHKPYDKHGRSSCYLNPFSNLPRIYYYGAFFGGLKRCMMNMCCELLKQQTANKKKNHEPIWNDESYLNTYFHYNQPTRIIKIEDFKFIVSHKGGLKDTRNIDEIRDILSNIKNQMIKHKDEIYDIKFGKIIPIN